MFSCRSPSTLRRIDILNVFSLLQSTLVSPKSVLGKLVNALVGRGTTRLDHIQNTTLIRGQANDFASNFTAESSALTKGL